MIEQDLSEDIIKMAKHLSMLLGIPLIGNPANINFVVQCTNEILKNLNPNWQSIQFLETENNTNLNWRKLIKIIQAAFIEQGETILNDQQQLTQQAIGMIYQILCDACQVLNQQNLSSNDIQQSKSIKPGFSSTNIQMRNNPESKHKINEQKSKQKVKNQKRFITKKQRPKTAQNKKKINTLNNLQVQIIDTVAKTMGKSYNKKANPQLRANIRQKEGTQAVKKAQRTLDYAIKNYQRTMKQKNKVKINKKQNQKQDLTENAYMKMIANRHKKLNEELQDQQLKYYMELRDKKIAYVRHIHKLIEKLQRQRQIEFHKKERQLQTVKKLEMNKKIQIVDNLFHKNMEKLHQNYENRKKIQELQNVGELEVCRAMEKQIKIKKNKQMEDIKNLWQAQRNQLQRITSDQQKMKNKLIEMYRKYKV